jgi:hypothetical protein
MDHVEGIFEEVRDAITSAQIAQRREQSKSEKAWNCKSPNAMGIKSHPDWHDVSAAERKDPFHAAALQKPRDEIGSAVLRDFHCSTPLVIVSHN